MSYYYSDNDIERMYNAGILHRRGSSTQHERDLIQKNTKCSKCGGDINVSQYEIITCKKCGHILC